VHLGAEEDGVGGGISDKDASGAVVQRRPDALAVSAVIAEQPEGTVFIEGNKAVSLRFERAVFERLLRPEGFAGGRAAQVEAAAVPHGDAVADEAEMVREHGVAGRIGRLLPHGLLSEPSGHRQIAGALAVAPLAGIEDEVIGHGVLLMSRLRAHDQREEGADEGRPFDHSSHSFRRRLDVDDAVSLVSPLRPVPLTAGRPNCAA